MWIQKSRAEATPADAQPDTQNVESSTNSDAELVDIPRTGTVTDGVHEQ